MMKSIIVKLSLAAFALASSSALACIPVTQADLPLTINQTGTYCVSEDLQGSRNLTAITILADNVTLDLEGYTLKGGLVGVTSRNDGVIIKNGTIANARNGVIIVGSSGDKAKNNTVENINFVNLTSRVVGITHAQDVKLFNNSMGLAVNSGWADVIHATRIEGLHIKNNSISMRATDLNASATAFRGRQVTNAVIENNSFFGVLVPRDNTLVLFQFYNSRQMLIKNNNSSGIYTFAINLTLGPKVFIDNTIIGSSLNAFPTNLHLIDGGGNQFF